MQVPETFGDRLLRARRRAELSQEALGARVGLAGHTISRLERGRSTQISPEALRQLSRALNVSLDWLLAMDMSDEGAAPDVVEEPRAPAICDALGKVAHMAG
jgi:transcriptional regulator with XRE-family HTH domain